MVMSMRVNGSMIKPMVRALILTWMGPNIMVIGKRTNNTVLVLRPGPMAQNMKAIMNMGKSTVPVLSSGLMDHSTLENFIIITSMARVSIPGVTAENTKVNGETTRCMEKVLSLGLMAENMWGNMWMIKNRAMVNSYGLMVALTKEIG